MRPVAIGWRFVQPITRGRVPTEWMRKLADRARFEKAQREVRKAQLMASMRQAVSS